MVDTAVLNRLTGKTDEIAQTERDRKAWRASEGSFITRLRQSITESDAMVNQFRLRRREAIHAFVGHLYGKSESKRRPASMLEMAVTTLTALLVGQNPRHWITLESGEITPFCSDFELAMNKLDKMIKFEDTLQSVVTSSLFGPGIVRTGLGPSDSSIEIGGYLHDAGQVFVDEISLDDYIIDTNARRREEAMFEGNYYDLPGDYVMESGLFENTDHIERATRSGPSNQHGAKDLSWRKNEGKAGLVDMVTLIDVWIPPSNPWTSSSSVIVTLDADGQHNDPLRIIEWDGPEEGPYDVLGYRKVPDNIFDLPPMYILLVLDDLINVMARREARRAQRDKTVIAYNHRAKEDAERIKAAIDGGMVGVDNVEGIKELHLGGADQNAMQYIESLKQDFNARSGNLDQMGGYGSDANTATEFLGTQQNADVRMEAMRGFLHRFVKSIKQKQGYYLLTDPINKMRLVMETSDPSIQVPFDFGPDTRQGEFHDYGIDIHPYSMQKDTPQVQLQNMLAWFERVVMPTMDLAMMQGSMFNVPAFAKLAGKYLHLQGMDQLYLSAQKSVMDAMAQPLQTQRAGQGATQPAGQQPKISISAGGGSRASKKSPATQTKSQGSRLGGSSNATRSDGATR